jgi:diphosphomevalonate decarboxylase
MDFKLFFCFIVKEISFFQMHLVAPMGNGIMGAEQKRNEMIDSKMGTYGKLIWMGEHSVVYGHPAMALPLRAAKVIAQAVSSETDRLISPFYEGLLECLPSRYESLRDLIRKVRQSLDLGPQTITLTMNLPIGAGLGASAAIAGALVQALYRAKGVSPTDLELRNWIQTSETIAHGRSSGIDAAAVLSKTVLTYLKGHDPFPFQTRFRGYLFVADSGIFGSTLEAVEIVRKQMETEAGKNHIEALGDLAITFIIQVNKAMYETVGPLMNQAQHHLRELGVSHPVLEEMIELALRSGAKGAKLTGGGLGGCMIAYADSLVDLISIRDAFQAHGFQRVWLIDLEKEFSYVPVATARAPINIALIKYWGKKNETEVLPTAPSLSLSLSRYETITRIAETREVGISFRLNGIEEPKMLPRVKAFLTHFTHGKEPSGLSIESVNTGPTAAGLASSASAFAALAVAANAFFQTNLSHQELASITRKGSGSAVRSLLPGAVAWNEDGSIEAVALQFEDLLMGILIVDEKKKAIGSTEAMKQTMLTSPNYLAWVDQTRIQYHEMRVAMNHGDFSLVGAIAEDNALALHQLCETAVPPIRYLNDRSSAIIKAIQSARRQGLFQAYATMDAGPNVKVLCRSCDREAIERWTNEKHFPSPIWSNIDWKGASIFDE